jgi:hypothetical protein
MVQVNYDTDPVAAIRQAFLDEYQVDEYGTITTLGKFQGEPIYVPYFWEMSMMGAYDGTEIDNEDDSTNYIFYVTDRDRAIFPELKGLHKVTLWENNDGFVRES